MTHSVVLKIFIKLSCPSMFLQLENYKTLKNYSFVSRIREVFKNYKRSLIKTCTRIYRNLFYVSWILRLKGSIGTLWRLRGRVEVSRSILTDLWKNVLVMSTWRGIWIKKEGLRRVCNKGSHVGSFRWRILRDSNSDKGSLRLSQLVYNRVIGCVPQECYYCTQRLAQYLTVQ